MMHHYLKNEGKEWNHKRVYRAYTEMNLNLTKRRKRLPQREREALLQPNAPNLHWSMDFMQDSFVTGKKFRLLNIIDNKKITKTNHEIFLMSGVSKKYGVWNSRIGILCRIKSRYSL